MKKEVTEKKGLATRKYEVRAGDIIFMMGEAARLVKGARFSKTGMGSWKFFCSVVGCALKALDRNDPNCSAHLEDLVEYAGSFGAPLSRFALRLRTEAKRLNAYERPAL